LAINFEIARIPVLDQSPFLCECLEGVRIKKREDLFLHLRVCGFGTKNIILNARDLVLQVPRAVIEEHKLDGKPCDEHHEGSQDPVNQGSAAIVLDERHNYKVVDALLLC
jgi:hypothetical protein